MSEQDQTTVLAVTMRVRVPGVHDETTMSELIHRLLGTGQGACIDMIGGELDADERSDCKIAASMRFGNIQASIDDIEGPACDVCVDVDEATYVGDEMDGVYYQVFEDEHGDFWFSTLVDCNTSGFCEGMTTGAGPYVSYKQAENWARDEAFDWCGCNGVEPGEEY
jgi:hypothetical protein